METVVEGRKSEVEGLGNGANGTIGVEGHQRENARQHGAEYCSVAPGGAPAPRKRATGTAAVQSKWREISGISVENERTMSAKERRAAIRKLKVVFEQEIREELKAAAEDVEFTGERTMLWDPVAGICFRLEIGPTVLSRLMKELTGMSAPQMVDRIRAEGVRGKLRENLRVIVVKKWKKPGAEFQADFHGLRDGIKMHRRSEGLSCTAVAIELGFGSYTRFYRACLLCYGKTPTQLEDEVLREYGEWFNLASALWRRRDVERQSWDKSPCWDPYRRPYSDWWTKALRERPEWVARLRAEIEVDESVIGLVNE